MKKKILIIIILLVAFFLRNFNLNWDSDFHLHPDERFLTMVGIAEKIPRSLSEYLNPQLSSLNPENVGYRFFVYGTLPLSLNKIFAVILKNDSYNAFTVQGRFLSGLADFIIVIFVFQFIKFLEKKYNWRTSLKYWGAFLYAIAVFPIQASHFYTVDTFLNLFMFLSFYFVYSFYLKKNYKSLFLSAFFLGLAFASKITAVFILPLNLFLLFLSVKKARIKNFFIYLFVLITVMYLGDPYIFSKSFIQSIATLKNFEGDNIWYPPAIQWLHRTPVLFSLYNLALFGLGLPYFILVSFGLYGVKKLKKKDFFIIAGWLVMVFFYQSMQFVKTMRYFIFLYPFLAIISVFGIEEIRKRFKQPIVTFIIIFCLLVWPASFLSIYLRPHTRVEATQWINQNLEDKSVILTEHWDDALPLTMEAKTFTIVNLPVFDQDAKEKWKRMNTELQKADYYILTSNRGWGSITRVPQKYPVMSQFYNQLLTGRTPYKKIKEFTSYPSLRYLGIPFDFKDEWAEEAFTVYDHPKVMIFKHTLKLMGQE